MMASESVKAQSTTSLVNVDHLRFLTEPVTVDGREMAIVHIYSEVPDYQWVDAAGEGISAIDDVARAAVVYLTEYERTKDAAMLDLARQCLEFVRYMQAPDGEFYNFVFTREGEINKTGNTSYKSLTWWAMRALWSLGEGVRVLDPVDKAFADELAEAYLLTETAIGKVMGNYGEYKELHGYKIPAWLPNEAADSSSIGLLGMAAYYQARPNEVTAEVMTKIADGVAAYRLGNHYAYPFGMHPVSASAPGNWHDWGAHMVDGLAKAGMALDRQDWIASAAAEADSFFLRQLVLERFRDMGVVPDRLGQIAYGTNMIVQGYMSLYKATGEERYAKYAGLAASWYFGNNMAGVQMYDPATGRVFDGISGPVEWRVNRNSGAESTIEGLMSLQAVADVPPAVEYMNAKTTTGSQWLIKQAEEGRRASGEPIYFRGTWTGEANISGGRYVGLGAGDVMELDVDITAPGDYLVYAANMRQPGQNAQETARALQTNSAPTIDAKLDEWATVPMLSANTRKQFLRGVNFWQGADVDSHDVQLLWDADKLYMAVQVRDPEHVQNYTTSNVWHDDALWVYVSEGPNAQSLATKFTLAQTPDGTQVWNWTNSGFVRGAEAAWQATDNGYIFEVSLPWKSIGFDAAPSDQTIGLEVGRSVGGNSFMDLTGRDPDIASNLLPVEISEGEQADAGEGSAPQIGFRVEMTDTDAAPVVVEQSVSPDYEYLWLDLVWKSPVFLSKGSHVLRYSFAGAGNAGDNAVSKIDAFYLQPAILRREFTLADGKTVTLTYNTLSGSSGLTE
ncbi:MAG: hypothetical protein KF726_17525 [Anaerolineae bacterium]|nr:hypothetical protein [Anaerolineae bacterium]